MKPEYIAIAVALAVVLVFLAREASAKGRDIAVPIPDRLRTDLKFGYYLTAPGQIEQTRGHVNLLWCQLRFSGIDEVISQMRSGLDVVLDVDGCVFDGFAPQNQQLTPAPDAADRLRRAFNTLRDAGVLHHVKVIVPIDEPNLPEVRVCSFLPAAVSLVRAVAGEYSELAGVKLGCVYTTVRPMCHTELFDVVGFDDYPKKSGIFRPGGAYERFRDDLEVGQMTWVFPGGYIGQDPVPFVNFAHGNPEVYAVIPFLWANAGDAEKGIRDLPVRSAYEAAGRAIVEASN